MIASQWAMFGAIAWMVAVIYAVHVEVALLRRQVDALAREVSRTREWEREPSRN